MLCISLLNMSLLCSAKKKKAAFLFQTAEFDFPRPAVSPEKPAGCEDFPTLLQQENCYGSNQWLGNWWCAYAWNSAACTRELSGAV